MCVYCALNTKCMTSVHLSSRSGVVLTFYSNQQSFDSLESVRVSVNAATDDAVSFAEVLLNVSYQALPTLYVHVRDH